MIKKISFGACFLVTLSFTPFAFAKTHNKPTVTKEAPKHNEKTVSADPQLVFYSAHKDKSNYAVALYTDRPGKALLTYDSPTCQANSFGNTIIDPKNKSRIEFTSLEDRLCKITLEKAPNNQLKITKETPACTAWHGDFCSFSSLSPLTRIYPQ